MSDFITMTAGDFQTMQYMLYGGMILTGIFAILLIVVFFRTPAWTWLKAWIMGRRILGIFTNERCLEFVPVKYQNGSAKIKKYGWFPFNTDAMVRLPNGVIGGFALSSNALLIPPYMLNSAYNLVKEGIEDIEQAEGQCDEVKVKAMLMNMKEHNLDITPKILKEKGYTNYVVDIATVMERVDGNKAKAYNKVIDVYAISNFFKYNPTPAGYSEIIENEKAAQAMLSTKRFTVTMDHIIAVIVLLVGAAIAYYIITTGQSSVILEPVQHTIDAAGQTVSGGIGIN